MMELPNQLGEVRAGLQLEPEASYVISITDPKAPSPPQAGLPWEEKAEYPEELQKLFQERKLIPADPPAFLDHDGAELLLIGARKAVSEELNHELQPEPESPDSADIFKDLKLSKSNHPIKTLFEGKRE